MTLISFYNNDGLFSLITVEEFIQFFKEIVSLLLSRGSPLPKFFTNCPELIRLIPNRDLAPVKSWQFETGDTFQNVLGVIWNTEIDCFQFTCLLTN